MYILFWLGVNPNTNPQNSTKVADSKTQVAQTATPDHHIIVNNGTRTVAEGNWSVRSGEPKR